MKPAVRQGRFTPFTQQYIAEPAHLISTKCRCISFHFVYAHSLPFNSNHVAVLLMAKNDPPSAEIIRRGFGTRLRSLRQARGWEPKQTAARIDILYHRYMKYEEGLREPPFWLLVRMARLYSVTTDFLLLGSEGENQEFPISKLER
jgi:hypothetical protein